MSPERLLRTCLEKGINCVAVTDHNSIAGALELRRMAPFPVIVGEEVRTTYGEVMGLFLTEGIPRLLTPLETVDRIKAQGGLVCIPHPFDRLRRSLLRRSALESILPLVDIIEVFNSRTVLGGYLTRALAFAEKHGLLASAGSDAHSPGEVGGAYVVMPEFDGPQSFLRALAQGEIVGRRARPWTRITGSMVALGNRFRRRG